jgi:hypothetical protein
MEVFAENVSRVLIPRKASLWRAIEERFLGEKPPRNDKMFSFRAALEACASGYFSAAAVFSGAYLMSVPPSDS